jgi:hypothetical protein
MMLIPCPVHFFPTLPFWCVCSNVCGVINVTDAPVSYKKRCLCVLPKLRYAHDWSAEMVGSFTFVFILATILLPNDFLSKVVENTATSNSLEPPHTYGRMGLLLLPSSVGKILRLVLLHLYGVLLCAFCPFLVCAFSNVICPFPTALGCVAPFLAPCAPFA